MAGRSSVQGMSYSNILRRNSKRRCQRRKERTSTQNGQRTEPEEDSLQGAGV